MATCANPYESIEKATGHLWSDFQKFFESIDGKSLSHKELAQQVLKAGLTGGSPWWAQSVTLAYEKEIGRRETGQTSDGTYSVTVTKTLNCPVGQVRELWLEAVRAYWKDTGSENFDGITLDKEPKISETPKWWYWRASLENGAKVVANISSRPATKTGEFRANIAVNQDTLGSAEQIEQWRSFWKDFLSSITVPD